VTIINLNWLVYLAGLVLFAGSFFYSCWRSTRANLRIYPDCPAWVAGFWSGLFFVTLGNFLSLLT